MSGRPLSPHVLLLIVTLCAAFIRFHDLENRPAGLFRDEAEKGYNAWALAHTGGMIDIPPPSPGAPRMVWRRLPFVTNIFGNRTSAIYHYASAPFMLGREKPTVAATRQASALAGTLTVFFLGILIMRAWGGWAGLAGAAWLALCPWHLVFSRWALEGIFVPFFMALVLLGLDGVERNKRWGWPLAGVGMGLLFYAYSGAQPLVLAWGIALLVLYRRQIFNRASFKSPYLWIGLGLFLLPVIPTLFVRLQPGGSERLGRVAIWSDPNLSALQVPLVFLKNYLAHLNPIFLFFSGDQQPRHAIPGMGQLTMIDVVLLPAGIFYSFKQELPLRGALLAAFLCGPIPAALTNEGIPHGLRAIGMLVPAVAWSGLGINFIAEKAYATLLARANRQRARILTTVLLLAVFAVGYNAFLRYQAYAHDPFVMVAFQAGQRGAWERFAEERQNGQRVFLNGFLPFTIYYQLFYTHPEPRGIGPQGPAPETFIYFDPEQTPTSQVMGAMRIGDWHLDPFWPIQDNDPLNPLRISRENPHLAGEPWVVIWQRE